MSYPPNVSGLFENRPVLAPAGGIQHVAGLIVQQAQTIVRSPTAAGGINDKNISIALEHLWALTNRHGHAFPGLIGRGDQDTRARNRKRVLHWCDIDVLLPVLLAGPARPDEKLPAA